MAVHNFTPSRYYTAMGTYTPALHIQPGDTVITACVDAHGLDAQRQQATAPGNPMSGPFFVEGAEPGDTLVVHIDRITPSRTWGWTRTLLATNTVDPDYVKELPWPASGDRGLGEWEVDLATSEATLVAPQTALGRIALPIQPMIGCFGVAAAEGQAISTATSAEHGGNMDYKGFAAGVTVYFPVFATGALFFVGDVHALQGAGEIVGTGIEISSEVQFTVGLQKGRKIGWPRGENDKWIFTAGNARPLDQALQHATTEMARWLQTETALDPTGAQMLMGQVVEYEIGNVFDPAYTVICKMPKWVIQKQWNENQKGEA